MKSVGSKKARARFPSLLKQVRKGKSFHITQGGVVIAKIVPVEEPPNLEDVIRQMEEFQAKGPELGPDLTIRDLIDEGRR
jgi:prevent-host-death family protein